jgi:uncharacterized protein DUF998
MDDTLPVNRSGTVRLLILCAVIGPPLFLLSWLFLETIRFGYSPISQPISALAIGQNGIYMRIAFLLDGLLTTAGVIGVFQSLKNKLGAATLWVCTLLMALSPLGLLWAGIFTMNMLVLHTAGAVVACGIPIITFPIVGFILRRVSGWKSFGTWMLIAGCLLTLLLLIGFDTSVPLSQMATGGGTYGLWQRALFIEVQAWYVALAWIGLRQLS